MRITTRDEWIKLTFDKAVKANQLYQLEMTEGGRGESRYTEFLDELRNTYARQLGFPSYEDLERGVK